jgi:hypothetical protein
MTVISMEGEADSVAESALRWVWRIALAALISIVIALGWLVAFGNLYEPGDDFGYNLGLVGGMLMLSLLIYPLRKRIRVLERVGSMTGWFKYHMIAGIGGPLLVLFHSTFKTGSMNGSIALYAMLLVAFSGVVGRFLYRHLHRGLYGRQLSLGDARKELQASTENMGSLFSLKPDIEGRLKAFQAEASAELDSVSARLWRFATLRWKSHRLSIDIRRDAKKSLRRMRRENRLPRSQVILSYQLARDQVERYLDSVVKVNQLAVWERLFSLWHVIHIPFIYLLGLSGIIHVIAVHMY